MVNTRSEQVRTPLLSAVTTYADSTRLRLHIPSHQATITQLPPDVYRFDVTELPGLDDLFDPGDAIARAQELAAAAYGAREVIFSTCGSTAALTAAIIACEAGPGIMVPRHCHASVIHACIIAGLVPQLIPVSTDLDSGLILGPDPAGMERQLARMQSAPLVLVNPTYYGIAADPNVPPGRPVISDEAHGAHLPFHHDLPASLSEHGAGIVISGVHKTGGGLTGTSLIRLHAARPDAADIRRCLRLVHTSSPSYLLLASLDASRSWLATRGQRYLDRALAAARELEDRLLEAGIGVPCRSLLANGRINSYDPLRAVISAGGRDPAAVFRRLAREHGIQLELHDSRNLVAVLGPATTSSTIRRLLDAIKRVLFDTPAASPLAVEADRAMLALLSREQELTDKPRDAWFGPAKAVSLEQATGEVAAECIAVYPPGVCLVIPGQALDRATVETLDLLRRSGRRFQGSQDPSLATVRVVGGETG